VNQDFSEDKESCLWTLVRTLITEIVADVDEAAGEIILVIHWKGGQQSQPRVRKPRSGEHGCSTPSRRLPSCAAWPAAPWYGPATLVGCYMKLMGLVRAIEARDISTVVRYVNFDRVRASLTEQIASPTCGGPASNPVTAGSRSEPIDRRPSHQKAGFARSALGAPGRRLADCRRARPATAWHSSA
jgi:Protein of unknown function (DUF2939)